jgi:DNA-binding MarR family transcriptional regulator
MSRHTDRDARRLMEAIRLIVRRFSLAERADVACCGMTVAQAATLEVLAGGGLRLGELGRRLGIAPSTLSRNLDRLVDRGLVTRGPDPEDRRALRAELTADGRTAAASVRRHELEFARDILDRLPDGSAAATLDTVDNLLTAVRSATESCCPGAYDHLFAACGVTPRECAAPDPSRKIERNHP